MALFSSSQANACTVLIAQSSYDGSTFKGWNFVVRDENGNMYEWESAVENLGYGSTPTDAQVLTYVHDYLTGTDTTATYDGVEKITTVYKPRTTKVQDSLEGRKVNDTPTNDAFNLMEGETEDTSSIGSVEAYTTMADSDATPNVSSTNYYDTGTVTDTITDFDGGTTGQVIYVKSKGAITYDVTGTNLKGGTTDIVTADGDLTVWYYDGTYWQLLTFVDHSDDLSGNH